MIIDEWRCEMDRVQIAAGKWFEHRKMHVGEILSLIALRWYCEINVKN